MRYVLGESFMDRENMRRRRRGRGRIVVAICDYLLQPRRSCCSATASVGPNIKLGRRGRDVRTLGVQAVDPYRSLAF